MDSREVNQDASQRDGQSQGDETHQDDAPHHPWPFLEERFFKLISASRSSSNNNMNFKFKCKLCLGGGGVLSCQSSGLANLKKHIERKHGPNLKEFEDCLRTRSKSRDESRKTSIQPSISGFCGSGTSRHLPQHVINSKIAQFIINSGQAFSIVRNEAFRDLIETLQPGRKVPCYKTLMSLISERYTQMRDDIKNHFSGMKDVCTTADAWSDGNKSFLGVTAHTLDKTGKRHSFAIACRRLTGRHTFDVLAEALEAVHVEFNIQFKVLGTVTDNGSNFCKAFKLFGDVETTQAMTEEGEDGDDRVFESISDILNDNDEGALHHLPQHHRCAAHTLNLVATKDSEEALRVAAFAKVSRSVFAKCQGLWNKQGRSTQFADLVHEKFKLYFVVPNSTRWNSVFHSMERIQRFLEMSMDNLNALLSELNIPPFTTAETTFIGEYCDIMKPVAQALDILQGDKHAYLGYLLPTIALLKKKLQRKGSGALYCKELAEALCRGLEKRFRNQWDDKRALVSAVCSPAFKMGWIEAEEGKEKARRLLWDEMKLFEGAEDRQKHEEEEQKEESFFPKRARTVVSSESVSQRPICGPWLSPTVPLGCSGKMPKLI